MTDRVRMTSTTTFQNDRVTVFRQDGPAEGELGRAVTPGDAFETDVLHGKELARLGHAEPDGWSLDDVDDPPLAPHHQVSTEALAADRLKRGSGRQRPTDVVRSLDLTGPVPPMDGPTDSGQAAAVQGNRADGGAPLDHPASAKVPAAATGAPAVVTSPRRQS